MSCKRLIAACVLSTLASAGVARAQPARRRAWRRRVEARRSDSGRRSPRRAGDDRRRRRRESGAAGRHDAAALGGVPRRSGTVQRLLKKGAKANVVNRYGASPLAEAVRVANVRLVGVLLEAGADADVANEDGQTAADAGGANRQRRRRGTARQPRRRRQPPRTFPRSVGRHVGGGREPSGDGRVSRVEGRRPVGPRARRPTGRRRSATSRECSTARRAA